jgi:predicted permease
MLIREGSMGNLAQDIRFGLRTLRKNPGFTIVAVLVLAVGIGATTAIFTVVNAVLLHPLPYPDPQRLVVLRNGTPQTGETPMSYPQFLAWREQKDVFEQVAALIPSGAVLTGVGEPEQLVTLRVSYNLLPLMGVKPILGRDFSPEEEPRNADPVVILSHSFWQDHFHSDRSALRQKIILTDRVFTVIGVLPANVDFGGQRPALLMPLRLDAEVAPPGLNFLRVVAKLRSGLDLEKGRSALKVTLPRVKKIESHTEDASITNLQEFTVGGSRPLLLVLLGTVALVLLIACANIANLLLARGAGREKEIAIRVSLGAGRIRLLQQLLTESTLLALIGGLLAFVLAWAGVGFLKTLLANSLPRSTEIGVDVEVLLFTALLSLITGTIFGLAPALQAARSNPQEHLKLGGRQSSAGISSQRFRSALVVAEIVLSLVPLAGAGLLVRSFFRLANVDRGFSSDHVLTMGISPSPVRYMDPKTEINYLRQMLDRIQVMPGIKAAGFITDLPLGGGSTNGNFQIQGRPSNLNDPFTTNKEFVQGEYFAAMRIPLRAGRYFNETDNTVSPKVVVINETFARKFFPGENPVGKHIDVAWGDPGWSEIIGVAADTRQDTLATPISPVFYALISQKPELLKFLGFTMAVRSQLDPSSVLHSIKDQIYQLDKNQALAKVQTMDTMVAASLAPRRVPMLLMLVFAAVALFLAAIGIYGVLSYFVLQRRQEIGVRLALGAQRGDVLRLVLAQGTKLIAAGIGVGLVVAFLLSRALASVLSAMLFGIQPTDIPTFVGISLLLALLAMLACAVPALRATQVDPLVVLRNE